MKQTLAFVPIRSISPATLALGLWLGLALAAWSRRHHQRCRAWPAHGATYSAW